MSCIRQVALIQNCGYARACIYNNSMPTRTGRYARKEIDTQTRLTRLTSQFSTYSNIPEGYFEARGKNNLSQFDCDCSKILSGFTSKFRSEIGLCRQSYLQAFSLSKWSELSGIEKKQHTLSNCNRCYECHEELQRSYPLKPFYQPEPIVKLNVDSMQTQGVRKFTTKVLTELNRVYTNEGSTSFTDVLAKTKSFGLERKTEGESERKYHRKRLAQSFCSPGEQPQPKRKKTQEE